MKYDMFGQPINVGDYVCCSKSGPTTRLYIAKVEKVTDHKVRARDRNGSVHQKSHSHVFVCTHQIETVPELMI